MQKGTIRQDIYFNSDALEVYSLIMDEKKHAGFSNSGVTMSIEPEGEFSVFDGYCHGYNIELVEGEKIVQAWHFAEEGWPEDHFSICTFEFQKEGEGTRLTFTQTEIPEHKVAALESGWREYYWEPMAEFLLEQS